MDVYQIKPDLESHGTSIATWGDGKKIVIKGMIEESDNEMS